MPRTFSLALAAQRNSRERVYQVRGGRGEFFWTSLFGDSSGPNISTTAETKTFDLTLGEKSPAGRGDGTQAQRVDDDDDDRSAGIIFLLAAPMLSKQGESLPLLVHT